MIYDYTIARSAYTGLREAEDVTGQKAFIFYTRAAEAIFLAGASALRLSVYDEEAGHGLCGTLEQTMNEGAAA